MANVITQEILKELQQRGALADGKVDAKELAGYLTSAAGRDNYSQLYGNKASYVSNTNAADPTHAQWLAGTIVNELKQLGIPVVASPGDLVQALNSPIIKAGLRGTQK